MLIRPRKSSLLVVERSGARLRERYCEVFPTKTWRLLHEVCWRLLRCMSQNSDIGSLKHIMEVRLYSLAKHGLIRCTEVIQLALIDFLACKSKAWSFCLQMLRTSELRVWIVYLAVSCICVHAVQITVCISLWVGTSTQERVKDNVCDLCSL